MATMSARWQVIEDSDVLGLRIDLWNGHGITLTVWRDDAAAPFVGLRSGTGEHDLTEVTADSFRRWLDGAQGRR